MGTKLPKRNLRLKKGEPPSAGKYAMCYYYKILGYPELELYYCKIISVDGGSYSTCELYFGEEYDDTRIKGVFKDVCTEDIVDFYPK